MRSNMAYVINHPRDGVYLGSCMGLGFWSKLDPVGQTAAVTFADTAEAEVFMAGWDCGRPDGIEFVPVVADGNNHASIDACVAAGLDAWEI